MAQRLQVTLLREATADSRPRNPHAYGLYLQGNYFLRLAAGDDLARAVEYFEQALALDPKYGLAWSGIARAIRNQVYRGSVAVEEGCGKARRAAENALALEPNLAVAHAVLGLIKFSFEWDWTGADASIRRALEVGPRDTYVAWCAAVLDLSLGRFDAAMAHHRRSIDTDPLNVQAYSGLGCSALSAGLLEEADEAFRKVIELNRQHPGVHANLAIIQLLRSRPERALAELEHEHEPAWRLHGLALCYHVQGRVADATAALNELTDKHGELMGFWIAEVHAFRGEADSAFEWLERAYVERSPQLYQVKEDPLFHNIRGDRRYDALLRKMGFPP